RASLVGLDALLLLPPEDRPAARIAREELRSAAARGEALPLQHHRLLAAAGQQRWCTSSVQNVAAPGRPATWLSLLQDVSAEYEARDRLRRQQDELARWFELAGNGMLVYDDSGLILRSNGAFEALVGRVPEVLGDAAPELQALLGWHAGAMASALAPGTPPLERQVIVTLPDGRRRRLAARLACSGSDGGSGGSDGARRVLAVLTDLSAEDERDLARFEMGMLMDAASVGVATFDPSRGWLAPHRATPGASAGTGAASGAMLAIGRELVEPDSMPEYERLQRALRQGARAEVRYAVRHPEHGVRWLLTRVEPGAPTGDPAATSVVTLDVTDQERAQRRNQALLRELTGILETSTAGIASVRWPLLVRCNRRFERMLGFEPGAAAGATLGEIFRRQGGTPADADAVLDALRQGGSYETELPLAPDGTGAPRWASLSVRRAETVEPPQGRGADAVESVEAVVVLTDVTRLKAQQIELERLLRDRELMFNLSEVGIVYLRGTHIERANQAMTRLAGYHVPELTALDPVELYVDARECVEFEARMAEALAETGRFVGERRLRRRDGSLCWVQVSARPVASEERAAGSEADAPRSGDLICSFVDVDERHRARDALALQAERTRAMLNSVLVGIVTVDAQGIAWMNRSARRMFGGEMADFMGEPIATVATPEPDHPLRRADWFARLRDGQSETFECRLRGRDGREFWVVGNAVAADGDDGARRITFALLDIERRRQAELRIGQAQASLQRVIETAPLAIALFDATSLRVVQLNQAAAGFFGRAADELLGAATAQLFDDERAATLARWLHAAALAGETALHEWQDNVAASGPRVWDLRIAPLEAVPGGARQLLLVASDVTGQRVAEQARLQAAIAQREVLVREVHHRIKNNLQGVAGLLRQNAERHPEVAAMLTEAVGQVQAIAQVYGLQVGAHGPLGVVPLLDAIAQSVHRTFRRDIVVDAGVVPHLLPEAEAIPVALTLNELLTNAIKHGAGGEVRCRVACDGQGVAIRIASRAQLAPGFDLAKVRGGVTGLGLVRALLPRRSATLDIRQQGDDVVAEVTLRPPSVRVDG
ncbi:MAG: PAS domain S-box protein, partial [Burkholderiales bacterium]|nr:PAS domain S-box protein [Burkholderiales bacterium]